MFPVFLFQIVVALIVVGLLLWVSSQIPMDPLIQKMVRIICVVFLVLWLCWWMIGLGGSTGLLYRR